MILEAALYFAGMGSVIGLQVWHRLRSKGKTKQYVEPDSMKWSWTTEPVNANPFYGMFGKRKAGFLCPSCREYGNNSQQPERCACYEFPRAHFHFVCKGCKHEAIMRPADDPADKPQPTNKLWWKKVS
jgi:hypothetical protein